MLCVAQSHRPARPLRASEAGRGRHAPGSGQRPYRRGRSDSRRSQLVCRHLIHPPMLVQGAVADQVVEEDAARQRAAQAKGAR